MLVHCQYVIVLFNFSPGPLPLITVQCYSCLLVANQVRSTFCGWLSDWSLVARSINLCWVMIYQVTKGSKKEVRMWPQLLAAFACSRRLAQCLATLPTSWLHYTTSSGMLIGLMHRNTISFKRQVLVLMVHGIIEVTRLSSCHVWTLMWLGHLANTGALQTCYALDLKVH